MPMVIEEAQMPENQDEKYLSDKIIIKIWCGKHTR